MNKKAEIKEVFDSGIIMSKKAAERLNAVMEAEGNKGFGLRMEVTTGGCSGLNYNMSFEKEQKEFDKVQKSGGLVIEDYKKIDDWITSVGFNPQKGQFSRSIFRKTFFF